MIALEKLDKEGQMNKIAAVLPKIRQELNITPEKLEDMTNIGAKRIVAIEEGRVRMKWSEYLSIVFVMWANESSRPLLDEYGLFPEELKKAMSVNYNAHG